MLGAAVQRLLLIEAWKRCQLDQLTLNTGAASGHSLGKTSLMYIIPVRKLKWNRLGALLLQQATCDRNIAEAVCSANCLRMSHKEDGDDIVRVMNCGVVRPVKSRPLTQSSSSSPWLRHPRARISWQSPPRPPS